MKTQFEKEIKKLSTEFESYTALVKKIFQEGLLSLEKGDKKLAQKVIKNDRKIDLNEVEIEESCLKILALYQPVAGDLRHIIAILKINDDLERIADYGCNIAQRVLRLTVEKPLEVMPNLPKMFAKVEIMLEKSVDSIFEKDKAMAVKVLKLDDEVDKMHSENYKKAEILYKSDQYSMQDVFSLIFVSRFIERAADHTKNIAENVIYFLTGEICRHRNNEII